jgi:hypothetical protein
MWCTSLFFTTFLSFFSSSVGLLYQSHFGMHSLYIFKVYIIFLVLYWTYTPHMRENIQPLAFWTCLTSLKMIFSSSLYWPANDKISFFMAKQNSNVYIYKSHIFFMHSSVVCYLAASIAWLWKFCGLLLQSGATSLVLLFIFM